MRLCDANSLRGPEKRHQHTHAQQHQPHQQE